MPQASNSVGSTLKIGITPVAKLTKITSPEMSKAEIDVTTLDSTGGYKEFIPDFRDGGSVMVEGFAISDAGQTALKANFEADTLTAFTIETPNGITITFSGYVSKFKKGDAAVSQGIAFTGEIRVSGVVSYAEAASTGCSAIALTDASDDSALTAASLVPAFAIGEFKYSAQFTTETDIKITATNATASTTMHLYIDGVFSQELLTTVPSAAIAMGVAEVKLLTVLVWQTDKAPLTYDFMVGRIS